MAAREGLPGPRKQGQVESRELWVVSPDMRQDKEDSGAAPFCRESGGDLCLCGGG